MSKEQNIVKNKIYGSSHKLIEIHLPKDNKQKTLLDEIHIFCQNLRCVEIMLYDDKDDQTSKITQHFSNYNSNETIEYSFPQYMVDAINKRNDVKLILSIDTLHNKEMTYDVTTYQIFS